MRAWIVDHRLSLVYLGGNGAGGDSMQLIAVPQIRQEKSMACWHAAARMLYGYKRRSCIDPLPSAYAKNTGISGRQFITLAQSVGLKTVPPVTATYDWTFIDNLLHFYGPIWAAGIWNGAPHVIVVTGVSADGTLYAIDPADGMLHVHDMTWFNERIAKDVGIPMMYLPY
jgi:Papain-like cysteine protease AvrRpt2